MADGQHDSIDRTGKLRFPHGHGAVVRLVEMREMAAEAHGAAARDHAHVMSVPRNRGACEASASQDGAAAPQCPAEHRAAHERCRRPAA